MDSVEVDCVDRDEWYAILDDFDDANMFQTWDFGRVAHPDRTLSHVVIRDGAIPIAAAQVLLRRVPGIGGMALVMWGPMWRRRGRPADPTVLHDALRALKAEYVERRGLMLRVVPCIAEGRGADEAIAIFESLGLRRNERATPYRTLILDVTPDEAGIRANMLKEWRRNLTKAEKLDIEITEGTDPAIFATIDDFFVELQRRKGFTAFDSRIISNVHRALPENRKMRAFLARVDGKPVAGVVVSMFGSTGQMQNSATSVAALTLNVSYVLQLRAALWVKSMGGLRYDLHGANAENNPGVYRFKRGLVGKNACDTVHIGTFESAGPFASRLLVEGGETMRSLMRKAQGRWRPQSKAETADEASSYEDA